MDDHVFSIGDIIKVRNGVKLPSGYTATCGEWVGVICGFDMCGRIGVKTLITRNGEWRDREGFSPTYFVEERFFEIA